MKIQKLCCGEQGINMDKRFLVWSGMSVFVAVVLCGLCGSNIAYGSGGGREELRKDDVSEEERFLSARPVWPKGRETEMNLFVGFRVVFDRPKSGAAVLRIAGSSVYRIFLNGEFVGYGPARGPHGYYRVDEWQLRKLAAGENVVAI
jgi:hypothetical protein